MLSDANFLILDEPTNHLDIDSKEILERAVNHFEGTVLYVSHDRYFINRTATRILDLTQKQLVNYIGNYDYYLEKKEANELAQLTAPVIDTADQPADTASDSKLTWQQQKEEQARLRKKQNAGRKRNCRTGRKKRVSGRTVIRSQKWDRYRTSPETRIRKGSQ